MGKGEGEEEEETEESSFVGVCVASLPPSAIFFVSAKSQPEKCFELFPK